VSPQARGFLDKEEISFPCPKCGRTVKQRIGDGRTNRSIRCPGGHTIHVDGTDLDRGTRQVEQSLDKLFGRFD
jgi:DNA-directed RNA polymerase subunit RPC12/RpoP